MSPELAEQKQIEAYRAMSGEERLAIGLRLHELACGIARESVRSRFPTATPEEIEDKLRERLSLHYNNVVTQTPAIQAPATHTAIPLSSSE
jgi:hypothetical protein